MAWDRAWEAAAVDTGPGFVRTDAPGGPRSRHRRVLLITALSVVAVLLLGVLAQRAIVLARETPGTAPAAAAPRATAPPADPADRPLPPGTSRFVPTRPVPLLDIPAASPAGTRAARLPARATRPAAVALAVTIAGAAKAGPITVSAATPPPAPQLQAAGPGATTSGLVVVPVDDVRIVKVRSTVGGRVVVALVGVFEPVAGPAAAGRTVVLPPQRVAHRVTREVGTDGTVDTRLPAAIPDRGVAAVLARVTADVGRRGGVLTIGGSTLRWSPPTGPDKIRSGLAYVLLDRDGRFPVSYHGGAVLDVDVLAYVTGPSAVRSAAGLFVPAAGATQARVGPGRTAPVTAAGPAALLVLTARGAPRAAGTRTEGGRAPRRVLVSPGRSVARSTLVAAGTPLALGAARDTTVRADLVGVFLEGSS